MNSIESKVMEAMFRFGMYLKEADNEDVKIKAKEYIKELNKITKYLKELKEPMPSIVKEFKSICNLMLKSDDNIEMFRNIDLRR